MPILEPTLDVTGETYARNRAARLAAFAALREQPEPARTGGGKKYADRHRARGRLPVREMQARSLAGHYEHGQGGR